MREILNGFRHDTMTVVRMVIHEPADGEESYGAEVEEPQTVYTNVPCRLSFSGVDVPDTTEFPTAEYQAKLFYMPNITIQKNDVITVSRNGNTYKGRAGETAVYPSHKETPLHIITR